MTTSFEKKVKGIKKLFENLKDFESRYLKIIELGKKSPALEEIHKKKENLVDGCQSITYIHCFKHNKNLQFKAESNALISNGLAYILTYVYSGETPEYIIKNEPAFIKDLKILETLSPNRANGFFQIYIKMKKIAYSFIT